MDRATHTEATLCLTLSFTLLVSPLLPSVLRHNPSQTINIGLGQLLAVFVQFGPRVPLRAEEFAGDAVAFAAGEIYGKAGAEAQGCGPFSLPLLVLLVEGLADLLRAGSEDLIDEACGQRARGY